MSLLRKIVVFLCGVIYLDLCSAQILLPGKCPKVSVQQDFEPAKYLGKWYEIEKYFFIFELGGKCVIADYEDKGNGQISVKNSEINVLQGNKRVTVELNGELVNPNEGRLAVTFPMAPNGFAAPYLIVDTDYTTYALVFSCTDFGFFNLQFSWILTRERHPPKEAVQKAYEAVDKNGIARKYFHKTDQSNCPADNL